VRRGKDIEELNELIRKLRDSHALDAAQEQLDRLEELARELSERGPRVIVVPTNEEPSTSGGSSHLRYAGSVGDSEVEVRGASEVVVTEEASGALTINAGDTTIRIRRKAD
jgi:hypothetical protein